MTLNHPPNRSILVFGSTGQQGGAVASALISVSPRRCSMRMIFSSVWLP